MGFPGEHPEQVVQKANVDNNAPRILGHIMIIKKRTYILFSYLISFLHILFYLSPEVLRSTLRLSRLLGHFDNRRCCACGFISACLNCLLTCFMSRLSYDFSSGSSTATRIFWQPVAFVHGGASSSSSWGQCRAANGPGWDRFVLDPSFIVQA